MIRFYFKKGRWRVTSDNARVLAVEWWAAINHVKCLNHKLREAERISLSKITETVNPSPD